MPDVVLNRPVVFTDSVTALDSTARGAVVVSGSHGGRLSAVIALRAQVAGLVLHDAGIGRDWAGIGSLALLDEWDVPGATIDHLSARIGDAAHCGSQGVLSRVNAAACRLGVREGQAVGTAVGILRAAMFTAATTSPTGQDLDLRTPSRHIVVGERRPVWLLDSVSQVEQRHRAAVVVTGSHGCLLGGRPSSAIGISAFAAVFNDAGCVPSRLDVLDVTGTAGVTVAADSARIGDAESTLADGVISFVNATASRLGAQVGASVGLFVAQAALAPER